MPEQVLMRESLVEFFGEGEFKKLCNHEAGHIAEFLMRASSITWCENSCSGCASPTTAKPRGILLRA